MLFALDGLFDTKMHAYDCVLVMACSSSRINTAENLCGWWVFANCPFQKQVH